MSQNEQRPGGGEPGLNDGERVEQPLENDQNETVATGKKPTLAEIAAVWGCSVPYISKCKGKGCPVDSIEASLKWRLEQANRGAGFRSKGVRGGENAPPAGQARKLKKLRDPKASLAAAIWIEEQTLGLVESAIEAKSDEKLPLRITAHNKAKELRYESEKSYREYLKEVSALVPFSEAQAFLGKVLGSLFSRLRAVPKRGAMRANPADDVLAEKVISEEIEAAIAEVRRSYVGEITIPE